MVNEKCKNCGYRKMIEPIKNVIMLDETKNDSFKDLCRYYGIAYCTNIKDFNEFIESNK
ncbi:MAG: hypothetical protein ACFFKA_18885 [Candidatus Thorarchaeota archaeon]